MRSTLLLAALAVVGFQTAGAQSLGVGSKAPAIKAHKIVQGKNATFGDGNLHIIEMFATW